MAVLAEGLDYSAGRPSGAALADRGVRFVLRYVDRPELMAGKHITRAEYADLVAHGIQVWLVAERNTTDWQAGRAGGAALARDGRAGADYVGYPPGGLIFLTADMHLTAAQVPVALAFVAGGVSVLGWAATGGYGFSELIRALKAANTCRGLWQTGSRSALVPGVHIYQANDRANVVIDGVACDVDELIIPLEEDELTPEERAQIKADTGAEIEGALVRVMSWLTRGEHGENGMVSPTGKVPASTAGPAGDWGWVDDPGTVTLDELAGQVSAVRADQFTQARQLATLLAALASLTAAVAAQHQMSAEELAAAVRDALASGVVDVAVDVTVHGDLAPVTP
jgi:hypothetical protein